MRRPAPDRAGIEAAGSSDGAAAVSDADDDGSVRGIKDHTLDLTPETADGTFSCDLVRRPAPG